MKKKTTAFILCAFPMLLIAQPALNNNGGNLTITSGATLFVNGSLSNQSGSILTNNGTLTIKGDITNNQSMAASNAGTLTFSGTSAQTLSGAGTYFAKDVVINNANGVTINSPLKIDGVCNFTNGIVTAASALNAVTFTTNASVSGVNVPSDISHINGYVVKEGTGSFVFPVGNGARYQKVSVNLSANATGLQAKYNSTDAGAGTFTNGGTDPTPLLSYNSSEHWLLTPLSTATGTVTIFWDGFNDSYINPVAQRKVAHKVGSNWLNEGATASGTTAAGSVTSNSISSWSPFTLGSITTVLPLSWISITGNLNNNNQPVINWKIQESRVAKYEIEKSSNGKDYLYAGFAVSKGDGENSYSFTEVASLTGIAFYRVKQIDLDGRFTYSSVVKLNNKFSNQLSVYPNPVKDLLTITAGRDLLNTTAQLLDKDGRLLQKLEINNLSFTITMTKYPAGVYFLRLNNGVIEKIVKQ